MRYCCPRGIPLTRFTEQRLGPPDWTVRDINAALEWQIHEDAHCGNCGMPLEESQQADNTFAYRSEAVACHGCRAVQREARKLEADEQPLVRYRVWKVPDGSVSDTGSNGSETQPVSP
jgi:hypothetical protein